MPSTERAQHRVISDADVPAVAAFFHEHLNSAVSTADWATVMRTTWTADVPNHGFFMTIGSEGSNERVVGAHAAIYSDREIRGKRVRVCNLAAWCVLEEHRFAGLRLLQSLLKQDGYEFTDMSPSGSVVPLLERLGFHHLDTSTAVAPNLPWPSIPGRTTVTSDPAVIAAALDGAELRIFRDHEHALGARQLLIRRGDQRCLVVWRRDRRWGRVPLSSILYVSNRSLYRACRGVVARHLLVRHRVPATLAELRVVGQRPRLSLMLGHPVAKMYRSDALAANEIDCLYSELTALP